MKFVLGGMGNIKGSIIAAIILTLLPEVLRGVADYRMLVYSIVLIAMMLFNNSKFKESSLPAKYAPNRSFKGGVIMALLEVP